MDKAPDLTLDTVKKSVKPTGGQVYRASDFMTTEEREELVQNTYFAKSEKKFDAIDALVAEILARFGWRAYKAWQDGELGTDRVVRLLAAERARDRATRLNLEAIVMAMVGACVRREKGQPAPKGVKLAQKIYSEEVQIAKGVR